MSNIFGGQITQPAAWHVNLKLRKSNRSRGATQSGNFGREPPRQHSERPDWTRFSKTKITHLNTKWKWTRLLLPSSYHCQKLCHTFGRLTWRSQRWSCDLGKPFGMVRRRYDSPWNIRGIDAISWQSTPPYTNKRKWLRQQILALYKWVKLTSNADQCTHLNVPSKHKGPFLYPNHRTTMIQQRFLIGVHQSNSTQGKKDNPFPMKGQTVEN